MYTYSIHRISTGSYIDSCVANTPQEAIDQSIGLCPSTYVPARYAVSAPGHGQFAIFAVTVADAADAYEVVRITQASAPAAGVADYRIHRVSDGNWVSSARASSPESAIEQVRKGIYLDFFRKDGEKFVASGAGQRHFAIFEVRKTTRRSVKATQVEP